AAALLLRAVRGVLRPALRTARSPRRGARTPAGPRRAHSRGAGPRARDRPERAPRPPALGGRPPPPPPPPAELTPEERAHARAIAQNALRGRVPWVGAAAFVTLALAVWRGALPRLRPSRRR